MNDERVYAENADVLGILVANLTTIAEGKDPIDLGHLHEIEQPEAGLLLAALFGMIGNLNVAIGDRGDTLRHYARYLGMRAAEAEAGIGRP
ncbi:MAG: hypothetical protein LC798_16935 [Chloroflexi bacterium]|nr:hypothetical protein [Chloroflexota bacterium]